MASPKKLKNGRWRIRFYDYTDSSGKEHQKSITAGTKSECLALYRQYEAEKERLIRSDLTVKEALNAYIDEKKPVLSPSTVRGYDGLARTAYEDIEDLPVKIIDSRKLQKWVNGMVSAGKAPKTISNAWGLLYPALKLQKPDVVYNIMLPQKKLPSLRTPEDSDIKKVLEYVSKNDEELELAIMLAAFCTLRRGEICALNAEDLAGNMLTINKAYVENSDNEWILKTPKTYKSNRIIPVPDPVVKKIQDRKGPLFTINPNQITVRFSRVLDKCSVQHFRFHDLRHYSASIMHALGIPDEYIMQRGGWSSDHVMKRVYRGTMDDYTRSMTEKINDHFNTLL